MILCGFACSGKTTFGKQAAKQLDVPFHDTDAWIGETAKVYREIGEKAFRQREKEVITTLIPLRGIVALGGGTLIHPESCALLRQAGKIIYLKASFERLFERILKRGLPVYADPTNPKKSLQELAESRFPLYEKYADVILETDDLTRDNIVAHLCEYYG